MAQSSFYADGEIYDTAVVESNDNPAAPGTSASPSSFYATGGVIGEGEVVSNEAAPGSPSSGANSSFFAGGDVYATSEVVSNDTTGSTTPSQAPSSFYPEGNIYDFLSSESDVVAALKALAAEVEADKVAAEAAAADAAASAATAVAVTAGSLQKANNLSDLTSPAVAKANLGLTKADVGLGSVDNTSDASKPVSTAQSSAITAAVAPKADKTYVDSQDGILAAGLLAKANSANPTLTGTVTIPTPTAGDNSTKAASTAFVNTAIAAQVDVDSIDGASGAITLGAGLTRTGQQLRVDGGHVPAESTATAASAGEAGEYKSNTVGYTSISTGSNVNMTSLSLEAGEWEIDALGHMTAAGATVLTNALLSISTVSGTHDTATIDRFWQYRIAGGHQDPAISFRAGTLRVLLSSTTTFYAVFGASFSSVLNCSVKLSARRPR